LSVFVVDEHPAGVGRGIGDRARRVAPRRMAAPEARARSDEGMRMIARQLPEPRKEARRIAELCDAAPRGDEDFLRHVLARWHVADDGERDRTDDVARGVDEAGERVAVAVLSRDDVSTDGERALHLRPRSARGTRPSWRTRTPAHRA